GRSNEVPLVVQLVINGVVLPCKIEQRNFSGIRLDAYARDRIGGCGDFTGRVHCHGRCHSVCERTIVTRKTATFNWKALNSYSYWMEQLKFSHKQGRKTK